MTPSPTAGTWTVSRGGQRRGKLYANLLFRPAPVPVCDCRCVDIGRCVYERQKRDSNQRCHRENRVIIGSKTLCIGTVAIQQLLPLSIEIASCLASQKAAAESPSCIPSVFYFFSGASSLGGGGILKDCMSAIPACAASPSAEVGDAAIEQEGLLLVGE